MGLIKEAFFLVLGTLGILSAVAFAAANLFVPTMINDIHIAIANGTSINEFSKLILGLVANGKLRFIETEIAMACALVSLIVAYVGVQGFLLSRRGLSLKHLFTKRYWSFFNWSFKYSISIPKRK